jgi:hypothetical protein
VYRTDGLYASLAKRNGQPRRRACQKCLRRREGHYEAFHGQVERAKELGDDARDLQIVNYTKEDVVVDGAHSSKIQLHYDVT